MTKNAKIVDKLNKLIQLDYDAIEAYDAAVEKLQNPSYKEQVAKFGEDHIRHAEVLSALVDGYGGAAATGPDLKRLLTKGKVVIADLVGGDQAILTAMLANEEVTNKTYEAVLSDLGEAEAQTREIVATNLADERRHRAWMQQQVDREKAAA
ncbi:MAG: ferritin-like domain-containing protein [Sinimarinibacterium flocculans]|uniref:ferritin-like domain-containing protein n=1 Tax=Sinimarinibacterium flocculans TaxID=985250 RepID=UPI003C6427B3